MDKEIFKTVIYYHGSNKLFDKFNRVHSQCNGYLYDGT